MTCLAVCEETGKLGFSPCQGRERAVCKISAPRLVQVGPSVTCCWKHRLQVPPLGHGCVLPRPGAGERRLPTPRKKHAVVLWVNEKDVSVLRTDLDGLPRRTKHLL